MDTAEQLNEINRWLDSTPANIARDLEAVTWARISKLSEEVGEVVSAYIGVTGTNPRKGQYSSLDDVVDELLDVGVTALVAVEHFIRGKGNSLDLLHKHIDAIHSRVTSGLDY